MIARFSAAASLSLVLSVGPLWAACDENRVDIRSDTGTVRFSVEVADDPKERSLGLMHRESMASSAGMLFVYERPQRAVFWMKNTLIPLDMIFMDATGTITHVHEGAIPGDLTGIEGGDEVQYVLEINAGLARRLGIGEGAVLRHPAIGGSAAWPCG